MIFLIVLESIVQVTTCSRADTSSTPTRYRPHNLLKTQEELHDTYAMLSRQKLPTSQRKGIGVDFESICDYFFIDWADNKVFFKRNRMSKSLMASRPVGISGSLDSS
jgi:hypothetical protein